MEPTTETAGDEAVQIAFAEEGVGLSFTEDGVKLVNQRKGSEGASEKENQTEELPNRGELHRNDSLRLLDIADSSAEEFKSSRHHNKRFYNHKLVKAAKMGTNGDPLTTQSDHGPAALSTHWMAKETPSESSLLSSFLEDSQSKLSIFSDNEEEESAICIAPEEAKKKKESEECAAQLEEQASFSILHLSNEIDEAEEASPTSKMGGANSRKSVLSPHRNRRNVGTRKRRESVKAGVLDSADTPSGMSNSRRLSLSSPNLLSDLHASQSSSARPRRVGSAPTLPLGGEDGGNTASGSSSTRRSRKKPMRRQRSKSLSHAQPQLAKSRTNGEGGISADRLRGLSRRGPGSSLRKSSTGTAREETGQGEDPGRQPQLRRSKTESKEGSRRLQRSFSRNEQGEANVSKSPLRRSNTSTAEGSRRLQRSRTREEKGNLSKSPLRRSNTGTAMEGSRRLQRSITRGEGDSNRRTSKSPLRRSNTGVVGRKPPRTKSTGGLRRSNTSELRSPIRSKSSSEKVASRAARRKSATGRDGSLHASRGELGSEEAVDENLNTRRASRRRSSTDLSGGSLHGSHGELLSSDEVAEENLNTRRAARRRSSTGLSGGSLHGSRGELVGRDEVVEGENLNTRRAARRRSSTGFVSGSLHGSRGELVGRDEVVDDKLNTRRPTRRSSIAVDETSRRPRNSRTHDGPGETDSTTTTTRERVSRRCSTGVARASATYRQQMQTMCHVMDNGPASSEFAEEEEETEPTRLASRSKEPNACATQRQKKIIDALRTNGQNSKGAAAVYDAGWRPGEAIPTPTLNVTPSC